MVKTLIPEKQTPAMRGSVWFLQVALATFDPYCRAYGKIAVMLRFGAEPTFMRSISFTAAMSITDTSSLPPFAAYAYLLSGLKVIQSG